MDGCEMGDDVCEYVRWIGCLECGGGESGFLLAAGITGFNKPQDVSLK